MKLSLGFSPCPNDTFIFDALVNRKIDTKGFEFELALEDVQTLNEWAGEQKLDISKISYGALPLFLDNYLVLNAGGALGKGVGPLLIGNRDYSVDEINNAEIAVPGKNTTAHLLFSLAYPGAGNKKFIRFDQVENFVLSGRQSSGEASNYSAEKLGVIIHENRFTYQQKGLTKIVDLGDYWEKQTGFPIPLGGIIMRKDFDPQIRQQVNELIAESLRYAFENNKELPPFVKEHSQEMEESVMRQHIDLYVNNYSLNLGDDGKAAVKKFLEIYRGLNQGNGSDSRIFSDEDHFFTAAV